MNPESKPIILHEIDDKEIMLAADEAAELRAVGLSVTLPQIPMTDEVTHLSRYRVNGNHHVGYFRLMSGRLVQIESKVPIANVFSLLAVTYALYAHEPPFLEALVQYSSAQARPIQALVEHFTRLIDILLREGLLRRYIEQEQNLSTIRGRFLIEQQIRQNLVCSHRLFCRFSTSEIDNIENRIVLWTLILLQRSGLWTEQLRQKIQTQIMHFGGVAVSQFRSMHVPELTYDRLSGRYRGIHAWCRFFIDQMTLLNRTGKVEFHGFRLNMFELFERFVFCVFQEAARRGKGIHVDKKRRPLDSKGRVHILPDVLVRGPSFISVGDAKYKVTKDAVGRHPDLYQVIAYSTALGLLGANHRPQGFLVYPASEYSPELAGDLLVLTSTRGESSLTVRTLWFELDRENVFDHAVKKAESLLMPCVGHMQMNAGK